MLNVTAYALFHSLSMQKQTSTTTTITMFSFVYFHLSTVTFMYKFSILAYKCSAPATNRPSVNDSLQYVYISIYKYMYIYLYICICVHKPIVALYIYTWYTRLYRYTYISKFCTHISALHKSLK